MRRHKKPSQVKALVEMNATINRHRWDQRKAWLATAFLMALVLYGINQIDSALLNRIIAYFK